MFIIQMLITFQEAQEETINKIVFSGISYVGSKHMLVKIECKT